MVNVYTYSLWDTILRNFGNQDYSVVTLEIEDATKGISKLLLFGCKSGRVRQGIEEQFGGLPWSVLDLIYTLQVRFRMLNTDR